MSQADAVIERLFRREAGKISAWLVRRLGPSRLDLIEDAVQDAFGAALAQWPVDGMPDRPAAWLAVAARNKALDRLKRDTRLDPLDESEAWRLGFSDPEETGRLDDTLALMFVACHPSLPTGEQTMLPLQTVCGFGPREIARAYLSTSEAVTQRLVRAKRKIRDLELKFEIPEGTQLAARLPGLLEAIYLLFNGGYTTGEGEPLMARELCAEALTPGGGHCFRPCVCAVLRRDRLGHSGALLQHAARVETHSSRPAQRRDCMGLCRGTRCRARPTRSPHG
jgi:RNA polymerase sigma-70 factor, ECF subfamily